MRGVLCILLMGLAAAALPAWGQQRAQPARYSPTAAEREQLAARRQALEERVRRLTAAAPEALRPRVADAAVFLHIAEMAEKLSLYTNAAQVGAVLRGLETGLERCRLLEQGEAPWTTQPGRTLRGFVSRIDGSIQPYGLVLPAGYRPQSGGIREGTAPRLDVVLHGRGPTEVSFLQQNLPATNTPPNQEFLELHPFGRGNNGWRWAGETDVFEALAQVEQEHHLDPDRILLRGFSMGGHGAWHIGVHHPTRWAGVSPGAGFSETRRYARITQPVPPYEEAAWHIYDAVDYALNLFNTPFITYGGDRDPQLQASLNMKAAAAREGLPLNLIIGPDTEHRYHPESLLRIMEQLATYRRPSARPEIRFTTWTLKYNQCDYVRVDALRRHYERAVVNAKVEGDTLRVGTLNVAALTLSPLPSGVRAVELDGERLPVERGSLRALREADGWRPAGAGASGGRRKQHGLQGPIDDAFTSRFVVVEGSGEAWSPTVQAHGRRELERFQEEWRLAFRGTVPRISDVQFREADWKDANLVLLGDPGSNRVLRRVLRGLPLQWSQERVVVNGKEYGPDAVPVLIYPNPLNPNRYVVVNSGHTWGEPEILGSNVLLKPLLPDWAVLRGGVGRNVLDAGYFDENWEYSGPRP